MPMAIGSGGGVGSVLAPHWAWRRPSWCWSSSRVGSSSDEFVNEPIHSALISEFYSPRASVKAFGIHSLALPGRHHVRGHTGRVLADQWGWRAPFFVLAVPTVICSCSLRPG